MRAMRSGICLVGEVDHAAAVAVPDERDVDQVVGLDDGDDVGDVVIERDVRAELAAANTVPGERDGVNRST